MITGGILSGRGIRSAVDSGDIKITPFDVNHVNFADRLNPASYDLTLGDEVAVYTKVVGGHFGTSGVINYTPIPGGLIHPRHVFSDRNSCHKEHAIDAAVANEVTRYQMSDKGFLLVPGVGYLMHTVERISTDKYVPIIDGKSSIGRLFCFVHVTAGYGDPGFDGQYTLEVTVVHPLIVYPGMRICQIRFHTLVGEVDSYQCKGNYQGELASGPVPSQSYKMFNKTSG